MPIVLDCFNSRAFGLVAKVSGPVCFADALIRIFAGAVDAPWQWLADVALGALPAWQAPVS